MTDNLDRSPQSRAEAAYLECRVFPARENYRKLLECLVEAGDIGLVRKFRDEVKFGHWLANPTCRNCPVCQICR